MNQLTISRTKSTPSVDGDWEAGILNMAGDSYPENSFEFFTTVIEWVERYLAASDRPLKLRLRLVYMNTSSIKAMMDIFDILADAHEAGHEVSVNWYYDPRNERIAELAEEFKEDCEFPFVIAPDEQ
jgi:hypothetical protein